MRSRGELQLNEVGLLIDEAELRVGPRSHEERGPRPGPRGCRGRWCRARRRVRAACVTCAAPQSGAPGRQNEAITVRVAQAGRRASDRDRAPSDPAAQGQPGGGGSRRTQPSLPGAAVSNVSGPTRNRRKPRRPDPHSEIPPNGLDLADQARAFARHGAILAASLGADRIGNGAGGGWTGRLAVPAGRPAGASVASSPKRPADCCTPGGSPFVEVASGSGPVAGWPER